MKLLQLCYTGEGSIKGQRTLSLHFGDLPDLEPDDLLWKYIHSGTRQGEHQRKNTARFILDREDQHDFHALSCVSTIPK